MIFDGDRDKLAHYIDLLAFAMGLKDWQFHLAAEKPDNPEHAASVDVRYGRKYAVIYLSDGWEQWQPSSVRQTLVHELLHCHINHVRHPIDNIQSSIGTPLYNATWNAVTDYIEYAVDGIAEAWAQRLPLPDEDF